MYRTFCRRRNGLLRGREGKRRRRKGEQGDEKNTHKKREEKEEQVQKQEEKGIGVKAVEEAKIEEVEMEDGEEVKEK